MYFVCVCSFYVCYIDVIRELSFPLGAKDSIENFPSTFPLFPLLFRKRLLAFFFLISTIKFIYSSFHNKATKQKVFPPPLHRPPVIDHNNNKDCDNNDTDILLVKNFHEDKTL